MPDIVDIRIHNNNELLVGYRKTSQVHQPNYKTFIFPGYSIVRATGGKVDWKVKNTIYTVEKNDIIVLSDIESRQFKKVYLPDDFEYEAFFFQSTIFKGSNECLRIFYNRPDSFRNLLKHDTPQLYQIHIILDSIRDEIVTKKLMQSEILTGLVIELVVHLTRIIGDLYPDMLKDNSYCSFKNIPTCIARVVTYIQNNFSADLDIDMLAKTVNMSRWYFMKMFKQHTGLSANTYISHCRFNNVINLIRESDYNILEAALASGYKSASGFYKSFKNMSSASPREFKL